MHDILKAAHLIMIAMGTGIVVSHYVMLRASTGKEGEAGQVLALARRALGEVGSVVVLFIWITGIALATSGTVPGTMLSGYFYAKVAFVILFTAAHFMQRRTAATWKGDLAGLRNAVERWVSIAWLCALAAILFAVLSFEKV